MLVDALVALAGATGSAVVGAMATDAWNTTRSGVARLFGRGGPQRQSSIEARLDADAALVEHASDPAQARQELVSSWQEEAARLLDEHPDVEAELRELVVRVQSSLPPQQQNWIQNNNAQGNATQIVTQSGKQEIHYHGPASTPS